ncbi:MAG: methylmalonyl-CoA mutase family protein [Bacteroidota bacterium]|nr:methylmalonyl-CoA mutase family protein [Bacteroidota bacterium]
MEMNDNNLKLFAEFPPVPTSAWEEQIRADLKGADYEKKLIWKTDEGFPVRPYYRVEDLQGLEYLDSLPGEFPFTRGNKTTNNRWIVRQDLYVDNLEEANRIALDALQRGADDIGFRVKEVTTHKQIQQLLNGIDLQKTGIHFISSRSYPLTLELFIYETGNRGLDGKNIHGSMNFDPISYLLLHGNFYMSKDSNFDEAEYLVNTIQKRLPLFKVFTVNGHLFGNAGANVVQELAFSMASANEYLAGMKEKGFSVDAISPKILFSFGIGSSYFLEIAKLRAARLLWSAIVDQYHPEKEDSRKMFIHSTSLLWNKSIYDPYVNMLRTTTEGMAAAVGNADSISILPFDIAYKKPDDFSNHIARNQQLILREEAYIDKIVDPSAGSYFIENLTHSIAHHSWKLFLEIESKGGMIESIKQNFIQEEIEKSRQKKNMDIAQRKVIMIGTNQYPNSKDAMLSAIEKPAPETDENATSPYKKITPYRGAMLFERIRLATEQFVNKGNKKPSVFLLTVGNLAMRKARATFTSNFFGCAGFDIHEEAGFDTPEDGINAALASDCEIIMICSSDEEYGAMAAGIASALKKASPDRIVGVAGYPKEILDSLKEAGVDEFIHVRSNVPEILMRFQKKIGIF